MLLRIHFYCAFIRKETRLIVLQRIEILNSFFKKIRKLFGRRLFTNFISKFFLNSSSVGRAYYNDMNNEYESIKNYIDLKNKEILSIGGGLGGLELILNRELDIKSFTSFGLKYFLSEIFVVELPAD